MTVSEVNGIGSGKKDLDDIIWIVSMVLMVSAIVYQVAVAIIRKTTMDDEDYMREYFSELEFEELIELPKQSDLVKTDPFKKDLDKT